MAKLVRNSMTVTTTEDGADSCSMSLSQESVAVSCDSDGTPKADSLLKAITKIRVYKGSRLLTLGQYALSVLGLQNNDDYDMDYSSGDDFYYQLWFTSIGDTGTYADITANIDGLLITKRFSVTKILDGASGSNYTYRPRGLFSLGETYIYDDLYRDICLALFGNDLCTFRVRVEGSSVTVAPSSASGDSNWEAANEFKFVATDFLLSRLIKASEIDVDTLVAKLLKTANSGPRVEIFGSMLNVYGNFANPNIKFGVNANGQAVLTYYDNNGNKIYDLGPKGFDWGSIVPASWSSTRLTKICNVLTGDSIPTWGNIDSQAITSIKDVSTSTGSDYYQYYAGSNPALTDADRINERYLFVYQYVNSSKIPDGWYARSTNGHLQYMSDNTQNFIKPEPDAIYEYAVGIRDQDPIYMDTIVEYIGGIPIREVNIFWNELIIEY